MKRFDKVKLEVKVETLLQSLGEAFLLTNNKKTGSNSCCVPLPSQNFLLESSFLVI